MFQESPATAEIAREDLWTVRQTLTTTSFLFQFISL